jgi:ribosomal protein L11
VNQVRIQIQLAIDGETKKKDVIEIAEYKLGDMTDEEIEQAIEIKIRTWLDQMVQVEWEVIEES